MHTGFCTFILILKKVSNAYSACITICNNAVKAFNMRRQRTGENITVYSVSVSVPVRTVNRDECKN